MYSTLGNSTDSTTNSTSTVGLLNITEITGMHNTYMYTTDIKLRYYFFR